MWPRKTKGLLLPTDTSPPMLRTAVLAVGLLLTLALDPVFEEPAADLSFCEACSPFLLLASPATRLEHSSCRYCLTSLWLYTTFSQRPDA
jgi:hypothetical protein